MFRKIHHCNGRGPSVLGMTWPIRERRNRGVPGWHTEWKDVPGLGTIPACWEVLRLGEVAEVQTGRAVNRSTIQDGGLEIPYLSVANVKDGYLDLSLVKTMWISEDEVNRYKLQDGDVLFTEGGDADKLGRGTLSRIHRMDGARTGEGGKGVTGAMIRARVRVDGRLAGGLQALLGAPMSACSGCGEGDGRIGYGKRRSRTGMA